jgi:ADP-ribose pyrophosphatase
MSDDDSHLIEHRIESAVVYRGSFFELRRDRVRLPGGREAGREYIVHPGAVMVVPLADDGRLVMERQYRYPIGRVMLEFPAGKLDAGEPPFQCAVRELAEETGYRARQWARAGVLNNAIAYSTEGIEVWFARGLTAGAAALEDGEHLDVCLVSPAELAAGVQAGDVTDAKTLVGLLWLQEWQAGRWSLDWFTPR